ncbi:MAG: pilus assembly FimT family protein [Fusobacteriaceae bacterium]
MKKNNGFSILEIIINLAFISIFAFLVHISYKSYLETRAFNYAITQIVGTISKYRDLSYYNNKSIYLTFSTYNKEIIFESNFLVLEKIILPDLLEYRIPHKNIYGGTLKTSILPSGNLSHAFTIYLFNSKSLAKYRIAFYTFSQFKFLTINLYKNISAGDITLDNLASYHETNQSKNLVGWEKE